MAGSLMRRFGFFLVVCGVFSRIAVPASAAEIWVAPTYQQDVGGLGVASNVVWPVTPIGAVRLVWAIPQDLQEFESARLLLIPSASSPTPSTLTLLLCPADGSQQVTANCAGPFTQSFTSVANQLLEIDLSTTIREHLGTPGTTYLSLLAFTAPTTTTDHIVGLRFNYSQAVLSDVPTLAANTFTGTQTAPAFVGDGSRLTNLPFPSGAATLGANSFGGTQIAPAFVGSGAGLTNLPTPTGLAQLSSDNTFTGPQTITSNLIARAGILAGVGGQDTTSKFLGNIGVVGGGGSGLVGIGTSPVPGYGLFLDTGIANITGVAGNEIIGGQFGAANSPSSSTTNNTGAFGIVAGAVWTGSADSSSDGLVYGGQLTGAVRGTPSLRQAIGVEATVFDQATAGRLDHAYATWSHIDNVGNGLIDSAQGVRVDVGGNGITNSVGFQVGNMLAANVFGIKMDDLTSGTASNYAIYTGRGLVRFGDVMSAPVGMFGTSVSTPRATIPLLVGPVDISDGTMSGQLRIRGSSGQAADLINASINGVTKFSVNNEGSVGFVNDLFFNNNFAIFGSGQSVRIGDTLMNLNAATPIGWSAGTHAYDTKDTGLARNAAGVVEVNNGTAGTYRDLLARSVRANAVTFVNVPNPPVEGMVVAVTDSTTSNWGETIQGGGTNHVLAYYNGTNWTVAAK